MTTIKSWTKTQEQRGVVIVTRPRNRGTDETYEVRALRENDAPWRVVIETQNGGAAGSLPPEVLREAVAWLDKEGIK